MRGLSYLRRLIGTGLSFVIFGLGGVILPIIAVPILLATTRDKVVRERRAQRVIHHSFRVFVEIMRIIGILTYQIEGAEKLRSAQLILANHPTLLDVVFLISMVPNANCVVKGNLARNLFTRGPIKTAGYIINDEASDIITGASDAFAKGQALIIFPEGTRTTASQPIELKRGAGNIAVRANADITPIIIDCTPLALTKQAPWYKVPVRAMHFTIQVRDVIKVSPYICNIQPSRGSRMLTRDLSQYFNEEYKPHE
ncbi:MAG: 1-acyl-sn-glycerol-3-phosphate acyltransferase [Gammaproteobacteria bacterium]|jgi:1-acyl-sn-glycerol-3-phosphate acyltransferase